MKNGHCMAAPKNLRPGMLVRTTTMAIGTAISSVMTVVITANTSVFSATWPKPASVNSRVKFSVVNRPPSSYRGRSITDWYSVGTTGARTRSARMTIVAQYSSWLRSAPRILRYFGAGYSGRGGATWAGGPCIRNCCHGIRSGPCF